MNRNMLPWICSVLTLWWKCTKTFWKAKSTFCSKLFEKQNELFENKNCKHFENEKVFWNTKCFKILVQFRNLCFSVRMFICFGPFRSQCVRPWIRRYCWFQCKLYFGPNKQNVCAIAGPNVAYSGLQPFRLELRVGTPWLLTLGLVSQLAAPPGLCT